MLKSLDLAAIFAVQHQVIKKLKKQHGLRQRDWEILCACYQLSLAKFTFTTAKVNEYLSGSYFLPCIYDTMNLLVKKGYLNVIVPGKPFQPERYEFSGNGRQLMSAVCDEAWQISRNQLAEVTGKREKQLW